MSSPDVIAWSRLANAAVAAASVGAQLIVQAPIPSSSTPAYFCTPEWLRASITGCTTDRAAWLAEYDYVRVRLTAFRTSHANTRVWDARDLLCPGEACQQFRDGRPLYRDNARFSFYGAQSIGPAFRSFVLRGRGGETLHPPSPPLSPEQEPQSTDRDFRTKLRG
jgi:hypothetical protein